MTPEDEDTLMYLCEVFLLCAILVAVGVVIYMGAAP